MKHPILKSLAALTLTVSGFSALNNSASAVTKDVSGGTSLAEADAVYDADSGTDALSVTGNSSYSGTRITLNSTFDSQFGA